MGVEDEPAPASYLLLFFAEVYEDLEDCGDFIEPVDILDDFFSAYADVIGLAAGPTCTLDLASTPPLMENRRHFARLALAPKN